MDHGKGARKAARAQARKLARSNTEPPPDSRRAMDLKALALALDLPEDSDLEAITAKATELKTLAAAANAPAEPNGNGNGAATQLSAPNADGTITLSSEQVAE